MKILKKYWDAALAFLFIWIIPLIFLLITGISFYQTKDSSTEIKIQFSTIFILTILLIIYFKKLKKKIEQKLFISELKSSKKHPVYVLLNGLITIISILLCYLVTNVLIVFCSSIDKFLLVCLVSVSIGEIFNFVHALKIVRLVVNNEDS